MGSGEPQRATCDGNSNAIASGQLGPVHVDHSHLKIAGALVRQRQRQVHEGVKLDGVVLAVFHGANEGGLVQALQSGAASCLDACPFANVRITNPTKCAIVSQKYHTFAQLFSSTAMNRQSLAKAFLI